jgi:hypothetical protein
MAKIKKNGGCLCGKVRFKVHGKIVRSGVCHCRYCQLRSGSAFGVGVWFHIQDLTINKKKLKSYQLITENKNKFKTFFCNNCGTTLCWTLSHFPKNVVIAGGVFDPPHQWIKAQREIFSRSRMRFVSIKCANRFKTSPTYQPRKKDKLRLSGI